MNFAVILLLMIAGSHAFLDGNCDFSKCAEISPDEDLRLIGYFPNAEQLPELCPKIKGFAECHVEVVEECIGTNIRELALSPNETVSQRATSLLNVVNLIRDLCDEDSDFHKGYVASINCFKGFLRVGEQTCREELWTTMKDFYKSLGIENPEDGVSITQEMNCLELALLAWCMSHSLEESCGQTARSVFMTALKAVKGVYKMECVEGLSDVKKDFLKYIDAPEDVKKELRALFELM